MFEFCLNFGSSDSNHVLLVVDIRPNKLALTNELFLKLVCIL